MKIFMFTRSLGPRTYFQYTLYLEQHCIVFFVESDQLVFNLSEVLPPSAYLPSFPSREHSDSLSLMLSEDATSLCSGTQSFSVHRCRVLELKSCSNASPIFVDMCIKIVDLVLQLWQKNWFHNSSFTLPKLLYKKVYCECNFCINLTL